MAALFFRARQTPWRPATGAHATDKAAAALKPSGYLVGKAYSIADIAAAPFAKRIDEEIAPDEMTTRKHPRATEWWTKTAGAAGLPAGEFRPVRNDVATSQGG
jgi:glutathione S-transferase